MRKAFWHFAAIAIWMVSPIAHAGYIFPTRTEWAWWPEYCKAKNVFLGHGEAYMNREIPKATQKKWESVLGFDTWNNIHHGCRGILHMSRAERLRGKDPIRYQHELKEADQEAKYSLERTPPGHPIYYKMAAIRARVQYELGNKASGLAQLRALLEQAPESPELYAVYATYLFREKEFVEARRILERGLQTVEDPTAEMHYFLGLVLVQLKVWDQAREHAVEAYELGYPLPGLRNKLKAAGHWHERIPD